MENRNLGDNIQYETLQRYRQQEASDTLLALLKEHHQYGPFPSEKRPVVQVVFKPPESPKVVPIPVIQNVSIPEPAVVSRLPSIAMILGETADFYKVPVMRILSQQRAKEVVKPRHVAMYLSRELTLRSLPEIGRRMGKRDHTTVLHGANKIERDIETNERLKDEIEVLKLRIATAVLNQIEVLSPVASRMDTGDTPCSSPQTTAI